MRAWVLLGAAIVVEVVATLALRAASNHVLWLLGATIGYASAFYLLALTLRAGMKVGVAYGIWSASGIVLTATAAALIFSELLTWLDVTGMLVIVAGVLLVKGGSPRNARKAHTVHAEGPAANGAG